MNWTIRFISKTIVGLVFTFSGFVKCIDPLGTTYKLQDYFTAFGWESLHSTAFFFAVILCGLELLIGLMLLFQMRVSWAAWIALLFMIIFTPLTLILAIFNPVHDCGCFGDALVLTNWQTFLKNVVLLVFVLIVFSNRRRYKEFIGVWGELAGIVVLSVGIGLFMSYNLNHLPIKDFRPYKVGVNIREGMALPPGAQPDQYRSTFIYSKDGEKKEFTLDNLPDKSWQWVSTRNVLISKGYEPPIHDFNIITKEGEDITDEILNTEGYVFMFIAYDLSKTSTTTMDEINDIASFVQGRGQRFIGVTSSLSDEYESFADLHGARFPFFNMDQVTLKTIIRSNPGLMLIKHGKILQKWPYKHLPKIEELRTEIPEFR